MALAELGGEHSDRVTDHMFRMAREQGVPFRVVTHVPNTHRALALGEFARDRGVETHQRVHASIFTAYQGEGLDIGSPEVLAGIAEDAGLDAAELAEVWETGRYDKRLDEYRAFAIAIGVRVTPTALICNELLIGSRPYGALEAALGRCMVSPDESGTGVAEEHGAIAEDDEARTYTPAEGAPPTVESR